MKTQQMITKRVARILVVCRKMKTATVKDDVNPINNTKAEKNMSLDPVCKENNVESIDSDSHYDQ